VRDDLGKGTGVSWDEKTLHALNAVANGDSLSKEDLADIVWALNVWLWEEEW
jgi:hypothetical protein